jgi:RsmE family RNA methyltransferase
VNLLLLDGAELDGDRATLRDRRARHLIDVLKVTVGQRVRVGVVGGRVGEAEVVALAADEVGLAVALTDDAPGPIAVDLAIAVPRPKVLSRVLQHAAACGVRRIDLVNAWKVDKSYLGSSRLADDAVDLALRIGAEQGVTTHLPEVTVHPRLMGYLDGALPEGRRLLADARSGVDLERALAPGDPSPVLVAIGPEGGWIPRELETFAERGFTAIRLGAPILRVEAAVTAALAQITLLRRL